MSRALTRSCIALLATALLGVSAAARAAEWGTFDAGHCAGERVRRYSAILWNVPGNVSWDDACRSTGAELNGQTLSAPSRCVASGFHEWGEFDVEDPACRAAWAPARDEGCVALQKRRFIAWLARGVPGQSERDACETTANTVAGVTFPAPTRCVVTPLGVWGEFDVADEQCRPRWSEAKPDGYCYDREHQRYSAQLQDIPSGMTWEEACHATPLSINKQDFALPTSCETSLTGEVGHFKVALPPEDTSCAPVWGAFQLNGCSPGGQRELSAVLKHIPGGQDGLSSCLSTPATMCDHSDATPLICDFVHGQWRGNWLIDDEACGSPLVQGPPVAPEQHEALYGNLRATLLARHFALGRYFRANLLSLENAVDEDVWPDVADPATRELLMTWNVKSHFRENPLLYSALLFTALSAEHHFGRSDSARILQRGLETLRSLYPYRDSPAPDVAGWIVRWDPVTSDDWLVSGNQKLAPGEFLVDDQDRIQWVTPSNDPRAVPLRSRDSLKQLFRGSPAQPVDPVSEYLDGQWGFAHRYRAWEVSMDELTGLVGTYAIVNALVSPGRPEIDALLRPQALQLGAYLSSNGYILVRPPPADPNATRGLNARGATGILPALEYPFARAFHDIEGGTRSYASNLSFEDALRRAGYGSLFPGSINTGPLPVLVRPPSALGAQEGTNAVVADVFGGVKYDELQGTAAETTFSLSPFTNLYVAGRAWAVYDQREGFDVWNDSQAKEAVVASLLKAVPDPELRFQGWMAMTRVQTQVCSEGQYAQNFPPFLALIAVAQKLRAGPVDPVLVKAYLGAFRAVRHRKSRPLLPVQDSGDRYESAFATAVAVYLGATEFEQRLKEQLDARYTYLHDHRGADGLRDDVPIKDGAQNARIALDYMAALALAWLHAEERAASGQPVTVPDFPVPPEHPQAWPAPAVPRLALEQLPELRAALLGDKPLPHTDPVEVFPPCEDDAACPVLTRKPPIPELPRLPTQAELTQVYTGSVSVPENGEVVVPDLDGIEPGDVVQIDAEDSAIHPGGFLGPSKPQGYDELARSTEWPVFSSQDLAFARKFALVARVGGGWFHVGASKRFRYLSPDDTPRPLSLRINDDVPGNGSGEYRVRISVWRAPVGGAVRAEPAPDVAKSAPGGP